MKKPPYQGIPYPLIEITDVWSPTLDIAYTVNRTARVDFQHRTITLPGGKFDLDSFLRIAEDVRLRLP